MKDDMPELDSSQGKRGAIISAPGKERITIRLGTNILAGFRDRVKGGGSYQTLINDALRTHITDAPCQLERTLRKVLREELHAAAH